MTRTWKSIKPTCKLGSHSPQCQFRKLESWQDNGPILFKNRLHITPYQFRSCLLQQMAPKREGPFSSLITTSNSTYNHHWKANIRKFTSSAYGHIFLRWEFSQVNCNIEKCKAMSESGSTTYMYMNTSIHITQLLLLRKDDPRWVELGRKNFPGILHCHSREGSHSCRLENRKLMGKNQKIQKKSC